MNDKFKIVIAFMPDYYDHHVGEIYYQGYLWVNIFKKENKRTIEFYSHPTRDCWEFPLEDAMKALSEVITKLSKYYEQEKKT